MPQNTVTPVLGPLDPSNGQLNSKISELNGVLNGKIPNAEKGVANGVATLGEDGKVLAGQLPATISGDDQTAAEVPFNPANMAYALGNNVQTALQQHDAALLTKPNNGDLGTAAGRNTEVDGTLAANSDALIPTQKAVKTYVDGGLNIKGNTAYTIPMSVVPVNADPFVYHNDTTHSVQVWLSTGSWNSLEISKDGAAYITLSESSGAIALLGRGDYLRVNGGNGSTDVVVHPL